MRSLAPAQVALPFVRSPGMVARKLAHLIKKMGFERNHCRCGGWLTIALAPAQVLVRFSVRGLYNN